MSQRHDPPPAPDTPPPVVPGVGSIGPTPVGSEGPVEEDEREVDPHPDTPDDFDEEAPGDRQSVEGPIEKD